MNVASATPALRLSELVERDGIVHRSGQEETEARSGPTVIEPASFALLPKRVGPVGVPLSRRINTALGTPARFRDLLAVSYSAFSESSLR